MDKQQQIEEMAKVMCTRTYATCGECTWGVPTACDIHKSAVKLFHAGYRKIPEGSVVLTKGAYESLSNKAKANVVKAVEIRKQAVKEFAERLKENFRKNNVESGIWFTNVSIVDKTAEEFGVEL